VNSEDSRLPLPPFEPEAAIKKVRLVVDAWNTRDQKRVAPAYTIENMWRSRVEFLFGREAIIRMPNKIPTEVRY
jgi:uncharacterized protein